MPWLCVPFRPVCAGFQEAHGISRRFTCFSHPLRPSTSEPGCRNSSLLTKRLKFRTRNRRTLRDELDSAWAVRSLAVSERRGQTGKHRDRRPSIRALSFLGLPSAGCIEAGASTRTVAEPWLTRVPAAVQVVSDQKALSSRLSSEAILVDFQ